MTTFRFRTGRRLTICMLLLACLPCWADAQLMGADTRWNDSFREWILYGPEGEEIGRLYLRWPFQDNWLDWVIEAGEYSGQARQKWPGNPNAWEIRYANEVITARTVYPGDPTQWRIISPGSQLTFQARHPAFREEWNLRDDSRGQFQVYTLYEGDPRQWNVDDRTDETISPAMKLAMLFLVLYHSSPKI